MTVLAHELNVCKLNKNKKKKKSGEWQAFQFYMCTMAQNNSEEENHVYITA